VRSGPEVLKGWSRMKIWKLVGKPEVGGKFTVLIPPNSNYILGISDQFSISLFAGPSVSKSIVHETRLKPENYVGLKFSKRA
jgi:hypothetical protein